MSHRIELQVAHHRPRPTSRTRSCCRHAFRSLTGCSASWAELWTLSTEEQLRAGALTVLLGQSQAASGLAVDVTASAMLCDVTAACVANAINCNKVGLFSFSLSSKLSVRSLQSEHSFALLHTHTPRCPTKWDASFAHRLIFILFRYIVAWCLQLLKLICNLFIAYLYAPSLSLSLSLLLSPALFMPLSTWGRLSLCLYKFGYKSLIAFYCLFLCTNIKCVSFKFISVLFCFVIVIVIVYCGGFTHLKHIQTKTISSSVPSSTNNYT